MPTPRPSAPPRPRRAPPRPALPRLALALALGGLAASAVASDEPPPPPIAVPGPLRAGPPPLPAVVEPKRPTPLVAPAPPRPLPGPVVAPPPRAWAATLPATPPARQPGRVVADVATHELRLTGIVLDAAAGLELLLVAGDASATASSEAVLAAKRVSLGRVKKTRNAAAAQVYRFPAELDLAVYRTLIVWSRRDKAPRLVARLSPSP